MPMDAPSKRILLEQADKNLVVCSHWFCMRWVALKLFRVSVLARLSNRPELRWALAWLITSDRLRIFACTASAYRIISTAPINTGITITGEITAIIRVNNRKNGKSISALTVMEPINERTLSNEVTLLAKEP